MTVNEIIDAVKELKVLELAELVKALEEEFGVSATPVAVAGAAAGAGEAAAGKRESAFAGRADEPSGRIYAGRAGRAAGGLSGNDSVRQS